MPSQVGLKRFVDEEVSCGFDWSKLTGLWSESPLKKGGSNGVSCFFFFSGRSCRFVVGVWLEWLLRLIVHVVNESFPSFPSLPSCFLLAFYFFFFLSNCFPSFSTLFCPASRAKFCLRRRSRATRPPRCWWLSCGTWLCRSSLAGRSRRASSQVGCFLSCACACMMYV